MDGQEKRKTPEVVRPFCPEPPSQSWTSQTGQHRQPFSIRFPCMLCPKATGKKHCRTALLPRLSGWAAGDQPCPRACRFLWQKREKRLKTHCVFFFAPQLLILASLAPLASLGSFWSRIELFRNVYHKYMSNYHPKCQISFNELHLLENTYQINPPACRRVLWILLVRSCTVCLVFVSV